MKQGIALSPVDFIATYQTTRLVPTTHQQGEIEKLLFGCSATKEGSLTFGQGGISCSNLVWGKERFFKGVRQKYAP